MNKKHCDLGLLETKNKLQEHGKEPKDLMVLHYYT